jgi:hypothetical protein
VGLSPLVTAATSGLLYQPQMIGGGYSGAIGGMKIGRGNPSTRRKPAPAPLRPPQIPLDQTRARTRAAAVGSQRLTAGAMTRPKYLLLSHSLHQTIHPHTLVYGYVVRLIRYSNITVMILSTAFRVVDMHRVSAAIYTAAFRQLIFITH